MTTYPGLQTVAGLTPIPDAFNQMAGKTFFRPFFKESSTKELLVLDRPSFKKFFMLSESSLITMMGDSPAKGSPAEAVARPLVSQLTRAAALLRNPKEVSP